MKFRKFFKPYLLISLLFTAAYLVLSLVRHNHFGSFGADLGFIDHLMWLLSTFHFTEALPVFAGHFEPIYFLLIPFYWLWPDPRMLLILQAFAVASAGIPLFLLTREKKLYLWLSYVLLLSYLTFYGVQNAIWFDFHTATLGAAFFLWFLYFLEKKQVKLSAVLFVLTIIAKENFAPYVFLLMGVHFIMTRNRLALLYCVMAFLYSFVLFFMYFPVVRQTGYAYANSAGLVSGGPLQLIDTTKKQTTIFYTFAWVGFLPFLSPLYVIPILGNLATYFILGRGYEAAHEIFMHYRVDLAPLLFFGTIMTIARYKFLNNKFIAIYLLVCVLLLQYVLHLPLSYLAKGWFWHEPASVPAINKLIKEIPRDAGVVAQNNIYSHLSGREHIDLLWPDKRRFPLQTSPCGDENCPWFRWEGNYQYMIVDLSPEWDIRHLLQNNDEFKQAVERMEKTGVIKLVREEGTARLYEIKKPPK